MTDPTTVTVYDNIAVNADSNNNNVCQHTTNESVEESSRTNTSSSDRSTDPSTCNEITETVTDNVNIEINTDANNNNAIIVYPTVLNVSDRLKQPLVMHPQETVSEASRRFFHVNDLYQSKDALLSFLKKFGDAWGFRVIIQSQIYFKCSRAGKTRK